MIAENLHIRVQLLDEYKFEKGEDAPMSMASHTELLNLQCYWPRVRRLFSLTQLLLSSSIQLCRNAYSFREPNLRLTYQCQKFGLWRYSFISECILRISFVLPEIFIKILLK